MLDLVCPGASCFTTMISKLVTFSLIIVLTFLNRKRKDLTHQKHICESIQTL